jgi:hypothetical protein
LGRTTRWAVAGLACLLVATSPEGSERMLVPMADGAAQLFTTLALWLLLRSQQRRPLRHSLLAGLSLGVAYQIRHPQLPLALAALAAAFLSPQPVRRRFLNLALFGLGGLVVAFPDLLYHRQVFGGWLNTESSEWFLVSWQNVGRSASAILEQGLLRREELGFLAPFAIYGAWLLWRRHRAAASILAAGLLPVFAFHLCYAALRPRDLIAILPALYLCAAYGFVRSWQWAGDQRSPIAAVWLTACVVLLSARSYRTVSMPWRDDVTTFGYVPLPHYQGFLALRDLTPEEAVIASMLNGGAIELYAGREAVHPAPWTEEELHRWVDALRKQGRPMYVLEDGEEMGQVMARLQSRYKLYPVQTLALPYFALGGGSLPQPVRLYKVGAIQGNG